MLNRLFKFIVSLALLGAGLAFALLMFLLALLGLLLWGLRALWALLTGRPVRPLVFTVMRRDQWERFYRSNKGGGEVIDVASREVGAPPSERIEP